MASDSPRENFLRLLQLLIEGGTTALRTYFDAIHPPATLAGVLAAKHSQLQNLYKKGIINSSQWPLLYPPSGNSDSKLFDITLLTMLLRNICGILTPTDPFWSTYPPDTDNSDEAHLVRIRMLRNEFGHRTTITINDSDFEAYWQKISDALVSLGADRAEIDDMKTRPLGTKDYHGTLQRWIHCDLQELKMESEKVQKMAEVTRKSDLKESTEKIVSAIASLQVESPSRKIESKDAATITEEEKAATMSTSMCQQRKVGDSFVVTQDRHHDLMASSVVVVDITAWTCTLLFRPSLASEDMELPKKKVITHFIECLCEKYTTGEMALIEPLENLEEHDFSLDSMFTEPKIVRKDTDLEVKMNNMFVVDGKVKKACKVLLEGDSGAGKTTLTKKLASDWAKGVLSGSSTFPEVELLLVLKCSEMKEGNEGGGIFQAIQEQLLPEEITDKERLVIFQYIKHNQGKVMVILDGLDEIPLQANSVKESLNKVISRNALALSYILVTSRPDKTLYRHFVGGNILQIKGLCNVDDYISNFFPSDLESQLFSNSIRNLSLSNPLTVALYCLCYQECVKAHTSEDFSHNITMRELYDEVAYSHIRRYFEKENRKLDKHDIQTLTLEIGKVAFENLRKNAVTFSLTKVSEDLKRVGFLKRQKPQCAIRPVEMFSFFHKSFQDYFCAVYLASRLGQGVVEPELIGDTRLFECVNRYDLAAMVGSDAVNVVESLARKVPEFPPQGIPLCDANVHSIALQLLCQCLVECKKVESEFVNLLKNVYQLLPCRVHVLATRSSTLLGLSYLLSQDSSHDEGLQTVGYVCGSRPLSDLCLYIADSVDSSGQLTEVLAASSSVQKLRIFFVSSPFYDGNFDEAMATVLSRNTSLRYLRLWGGVDDEHEYEMGTSLFKSLKNNSTLSAIHIHFNSLGDACASELAKVLVDNTSLNVVYIGGEYLGDAGVASIAKALMVNTTVRALGIKGDNMTPEAGRALGEMLNHNTTITCLLLVNGNIGDSGAQGIASGLLQNTTLDKIEIVNSCICATGVSALAKVIQNVTHLDLSRNIIGTKGAKAIAKVIENSCKLKYLRIDRCNIDVLGVRDIAKALSKNTNLEELSVACAGIDDEGMCELARSVAKNKSLQVLIITNNNISEKGKRAIIEACARSQSLNHLFHENDPILNTCLKPHSVCLHSREVFSRFKFNSSLQGFFPSPYLNYKQYEQGVDSQVEDFVIATDRYYLYGI
ncbi:protein NLRC3-like isoform X4 [Nematostella vectensis]|uniref:protein NLRC3-like isoform X4 n=1 Tax=Nematostella vectensis TaxID=45351 RepID=UPI002076FA06|nr:protein NLRC3-like isoform X4 [Nematostella vectensis]